MMDAVVEFARNMNKLDVYFVVYPKDSEMMEVTHYVLELLI